MARGELLSVLGLYKYDNTLFDNIQLPSAIDKEVLIENILMNCAELEVVYPNPTFMKEAIGYWSKSRLKAWHDIENVLYIDNYSPLSNNDVHEVSTNKETRDLQTYSNSNSNGNVLNKISAFNSNALENKDSSDTSSNSNANVDEDGTILNEYEKTVTGFKSVYNLTKQKIIKEEMEIRNLYDLYKIISDEFKQKFCLLIY